ncbi:MAG TPA: lyase family protein [Vicinamibacterales bacterium]|nr:lyase family protein [Vicinamibacterales bacterium]
MLDEQARRAVHHVRRPFETKTGPTRTETDNLASKQIPADAYWGINVARALDDFAISGRPISAYADLICNDLRLLGSGPQAGLGEINLPPRQAGSSIMPGKVNPVIPEVVNEVAFVVAGNDVTMTMAAEAGQLQLNAFGPVMTHMLFEGLLWTTAALETLRVNCVEGVTANRKRLAEQTGSFVGVITALIPHIGYAAASKLAKEALATNANIADLVVPSGLMTREQVTEMLTPAKLTSH